MNRKQKLINEIANLVVSKLNEANYDYSSGHYPYDHRGGKFDDSEEDDADIGDTYSVDYLRGYHSRITPLINTYEQKVKEAKKLFPGVYPFKLKEDKIVDFIVEFDQLNMFIPGLLYNRLGRYAEQLANEVETFQSDLDLDNSTPKGRVFNKIADTLIEACEELNQLLDDSEHGPAQHHKSVLAYGVNFFIRVVNAWWPGEFDLVTFK